MTTLDYILNKFDLSFDNTTPMPIEIPNVVRNNLAEWLHELDFRTGIEVGVAAGIYGEILCRANPQMKFHGIDPWLTHRGYKDYTRQSSLDELKRDFWKRIAPYSNYEVIEKFSMDAVKDFADQSLDFVYIDANHQEPYITQDITEWHKKLKPGGILAGHDYFKPDGPSPIHISQAVNAYTHAHKLRPWFVLGRDAVIKGEARDIARSWMWVKT